MIRLHLRAEIEFGQGVVEASLVHEHPRAVVADDDALCRIYLEHAAETFERFFVSPVEARERGGDELHANVVRRFPSHLLNPLARLRLVAAREIDEDHVESSLKKFRVARERTTEGFFGA